MESSNTVLKLTVWLCVFISCQTFAACQTKEQKVAAVLKTCQELLDKDDVAAAGDCYGTAVSANPEAAAQISKIGADAVFKKCVTLHDAKRYEPAIRCLDSMTALRPDSAHIYFLLADSYYRYHQASNDQTSELLDRAEETVKKGLAIAPDDAVAHELYGKILDARREFQKAGEQYQQAIRLDSKTPFYWLKLALAQEKSEDYEAALTSYKQVLLLDPKQSLALYNSGLLYEKLDKTDEAIAAYEKLLSIETSYDDAAQRLENLKRKKSGDKQNKLETKARGNAAG